MNRTKTEPVNTPTNTDVEAADRLAAVRQALAASGYAELSGVQCTCSAGRVILSGTVSSYHLKQLALHSAMRVIGAGALEIRIDVALPKPR